MYEVSSGPPVAAGGIGPERAPAAGYGSDGPEPLSGPGQAPTTGVSIPVLQWEIDPTDAERPLGEADLALDGWDYRMWWQEHPADLVYASIQALRSDDPTPGQRSHPVGRSVIVNLTYDRRRLAIVAIYGTARDFRPFVEAFRRGFGIDGHPGKESEL